jgi:hypothetical protein
MRMMSAIRTPRQDCVQQRARGFGNDAAGLQSDTVCVIVPSPKQVDGVLGSRPGFELQLQLQLLSSDQRSLASADETISRILSSTAAIRPMSR